MSRQSRAAQVGRVNRLPNPPCAQIARAIWRRASYRGIARSPHATGQLMGMEQKRTRNAFVGSPVERIEDFRFLRGRGQFVDDLARDDLLHAVILRSSVAHGRIRSHRRPRPPARGPASTPSSPRPTSAPSIPTIPLRQESSPAFEPFEQPVIAHGKVRYVGEPIAVVLAESAGAAEDALDAITLDIEPSPRSWTAPPPEKTTSCCSKLQAATSRPRSAACAAMPKLLSTARPTCGASTSRSSAMAPCRWSRAGCWRNGMLRVAD